MASDTFWPPGWNKERLLDSTQDMIYAELPEHEIDSMFAGLQESLGPEGWKDFEAEADRRDQARTEAYMQDRGPESDMSGDETNLAICLDRLFGRGRPWEEWGYVIYRTTYSDGSLWIAFKQRFEKIIRRHFIEAKGTYRIEEAKKLFTLRWMEDAALFDGASPAQLASHYRSTTFPNGFDHTMFLAVTPEVITSVMEPPLPWTVPYNRNGKLIPYVIAVDCSADIPEEDEPSFCGYFNVAVDSLVNGLFVFIADQSLTPYELGVRIKENMVWKDHTRFGRHALPVTASTQ